MFQRFVLSLLLSLGVFALAGCATVSAQPPGAVDVRLGTIEQIIPTTLQSPVHAGVGAVMGGIVGAGLGNLVGRGTGRDVATVLGALGGGALGNELQDNVYAPPLPAQQVIVRIDNGVIVGVTQPVNAALYPSMRVYVEGYGTNARVIPRM